MSALVLAASATGVDSLTPSPVVLTVPPGGSETISKTLHLEAAPAKGDIVIAIDTTGSMGAAISDAKTEAAAIVSQVKASIPNARFAVVDFKDYPFAPFGEPAFEGCDTGGPLPYFLRTGLTSDPSTALSAIGNACGGGDGPEAYNRVFFEAYSDPALVYDPQAKRFLVVLGDSFPHDASLHSSFPACPDTPPTDPGRDNMPGTSDDLTTRATIDGLVANHTTLSFVTYNPNTASLGNVNCHTALATATGGSEVTGGSGTSLATQIANLVTAAAARINRIDLAVSATGSTPPADASWFSFSPAPPFTPIEGSFTAPLDQTFDETVGVPTGTAPGSYSFDVVASADGTPRATEHVTIVVRPAVTGVALTADQSTIPAGIASVPIASIPGSRIAFFAGSTASAPVGSTPVGSTPVGSTPVGSTPVGSTPVGSTPVGSTGLGIAPVGSTPVGSTALQSVLLSMIPLLNPADGATWDQVLAGTPLADRPLVTITLADVANDAVAGARLNALPLKDTSFATTLLAGVRWTSLLLGNLTLNQIPVPGGFLTWQMALDAFGGSSIGVDPTTNTVTGLDISGRLGSTPVGSTPVGSTPVGSTPVGSTPVGSTAVASSRLAQILIKDLAPPGNIVRCLGVDASPAVDCSAGSAATLGDAAAANAIKPSALLGDPALTPAYNALGITINDLAVAILLRSDFPWEKLPVQGLQDVAGTGQNVSYHLDFDLDCSVGSTFTASVRLPDGFFVVPGSTQFVYGAGAPQSGADPSFDNETGRMSWTAVPGDPCAGFNPESPTRHMRVNFSAFAGLRLGTQTSSARVTVRGSTVSTPPDQAPVQVTQNWEPNDDSAAPPVIAKDALIVSHIAASGDQDFFRFPIDTLPRGTRISVFLSHIASGADFDLTVSTPSAGALQSTPVGSTPVGSTPIEDGGATFDNSGRALPSNTLQDIPVGSTPVGSTPVGSTPVGSTSTNRGSADEAAGVVLNGTVASGFATIGVSGYNGSSSANPYVLRVKVTLPPPLPPCSARTFPNPLGTAGALPASLPTATKTLFLVNKQRMVAMFGQVATDTLLAKIGSQSTAGSFAARPEVAGSVLQVDGNPAVRTAYAAWDATNGQCSVDAANAVVKAVNDVGATYRNSAAGLPNLHYVVLLGTDEAIPMARVADPTFLSPETDEASDLAFTTSGLTNGNALYAAAAQDTVLTDGAYGAFTSVPWLGHDLALPQVAVSRMVETPADIGAQIDQYVAFNGLLDPKTALTTGYDFLSDGAAAVAQALAANVPGLTGATLLPPANWTGADLLNQFFQKSPAVPDIGSLNAHYNHYELQPAGGTSLVTTGSVPMSIPGRILFSMGCHSGLNVADALGGDAAKLKDWAQAYARANAAVYVANSGFGYGDTVAVALSERLMALFAQKLNSDAGAIGEQWVNALHAYFDTAGAYTVYDEKVMTEATFYGLPFYHFKTPGAATTPPPLATSADPLTGIQTATVAVSSNPTQVGPDANGRTFWSDAGQTEFGLYRPIEPLRSQDVTSTLRAHGVWIRALATEDHPGIKPVLGYPTIDLSGHEPAPNFAPIFFPASIVALNRSVIFGKERDRLIVTGQFRPDAPGSATGTERLFRTGTFQIAYSLSPDSTPPLVSQVGVVLNGSTATITARVTDDSGVVAQVAALVNDGTWHYLQLAQSGADPEVWQGSIAVLVNPEVVIEGQDFAGNVGYSANKGSNFTSVPDISTLGPQIMIRAPSGTYGPGTTVLASFSCAEPPGVSATVTSCLGTTSNGSPIDTSTFGLHVFTVTATDSLGNRTSLQRTYIVEYQFKGFFQPVDNQPVLNVAKAGSAIPVKFSLTGFQGLDIFAAGYPKSQAIGCDATAPADGIESTVTAGASSLSYDSGSDQYIYVWKTDGSWAGTCRALVVKTKDGLSHRADFKFK